MKAGGGFGALALSALLQRDGLYAADRQGQPDGSTRTPHFAPKAKAVIFLFMEGGPSHLDMWDP